DRDAAADPGVLDVWRRVLELEQHAEPARVHGAGTEHGADRLQRAVRDERRRLARPGPARPVAAHDDDLAAQELAERRSPRPDDVVTHADAMVDRCLDR